MKKYIVLLIFTVGIWQLQAQELYIFSEPASNMPAKAFGLKYAAKFLENQRSSKLEQRQALELQFGHTKKWMTHVGTTVSDMYSPRIRWESIRLYSKYRFLSQDQVHKHFRAAAFGEIVHSVNGPMYDELTSDGDQSNIRGGMIFTQLIHKLAISSTLSYVRSLQKHIKHTPFASHAFNYSVSAGYLLFPKSYTSYDQTNLNLYLECLGSQALDKRRSFIDLAPALQLILNSNTKLNLGYRFQVAGDMQRMARNSLHISFERTFLNALGSRK